MFLLTLYNRKVKLLSLVWLFVTPWTIACQGSSVHGIFQLKILGQVAIPFSRGSSDPGMEPRSPELQVDCYCLNQQGSPCNKGTALPVGYFFQKCLIWIQSGLHPLPLVCMKYKRKNKLNANTHIHTHRRTHRHTDTTSGKSRTCLVSLLINTIWWGVERKNGVAGSL